MALRKSTPRLSSKARRLIDALASAQQGTIAEMTEADIDLCAYVLALERHKAHGKLACKRQTVKAPTGYQTDEELYDHDPR